MILGGALASRFTHGARLPTTWIPLIGSVSAMLVMHAPGLPRVLLAQAPFTAVRIALIMLPPTLVAHLLCASVPVAMRRPAGQAR